MFKWLSRLRCNHDYKTIDTKYFTYVDENIVRLHREYVLYCPKCDKEKRVDADEYDLKLEKQLIKRNYK